MELRNKSGTLNNGVNLPSKQFYYLIVIPAVQQNFTNAAEMNFNGNDAIGFI
jgi:hypothetical protein